MEPGSAKIPVNVTCLQWISKKPVVLSTNRATKAIQIFAAKALPEGLIAKYTARVLDPHLSSPISFETPPTSSLGKPNLGMSWAAEASVKIRWGRLRTAAILRIVLPAHASFDVRFRG